MPKLIIFDLDGTLARSKQPLEPTMAALVGALLERAQVAITSGGALAQLAAQAVEQLPPDAQLEKLFLLPTSGAALFEYSAGAWHAVYEERLAPEESAQIEAVMRAVCAETGLIDLNAQSWGERIEYRGAQVTLSALGQHAPIEEKEKWDPDGMKKKSLRDAIAAQLPQCDVKVGGSTSIDVTKRGVNKAYGVRKLSEHLSIPVAEMLYVGDALFPGGNDEVVKESGIATKEVKDPEETLQVIEELLGN